MIPNSSAIEDAIDRIAHEYGEAYTRIPLRNALRDLLRLQHEASTAPKGGEPIVLDLVAYARLRDSSGGCHDGDDAA